MDWISHRHGLRVDPNGAMTDRPKPVSSFKPYLIVSSFFSSQILAKDRWDGPWDEGMCKPVERLKGKRSMTQLDLLDQLSGSSTQLGEMFGGWASWTSSGWLRVVGRIRCGAGLVRLSLARVGNVPSSWSQFLAEGARTDNRPSGWKIEDLIGIKSRRRSDRDCWKNDPNMVDLREKAKQTATGTPERTSKDRVRDPGLEQVRSCDLMLKCWIQ
ncbi:hypothetical protein Bca4012_031180 [Brassica carinata]